MILKAPEQKTYRTLCELNAFRIYFGESERLIQAAGLEAEENFEAKWTPQNEKELGELRHEQIEARQMHDKILFPTFRYSAIVTLQAIIERELLRLVQNLEKVHGPQTLSFSDLKKYWKGSLLDRVAKFCEDYFQVRFEKCDEYEALCNLQKIRDCIVHCYGEVEQSRDRQHLLKLSKAKLGDKQLLPGFSAFKGKSILIEPSCVMHNSQKAWLFFIWVFDQLGWCVDEGWKNSTW